MSDFANSCDEARTALSCWELIPSLSWGQRLPRRPLVELVPGNPSALHLLFSARHLFSAFRGGPAFQNFSRDTRTSWFSYLKSKMCRSSRRQRAFHGNLAVWWGAQLAGSNLSSVFALITVKLTLLSQGFQSTDWITAFIDQQYQKWILSFICLFAQKATVCFLSLCSNRCSSEVFKPIFVVMLHEGLKSK